MTVPAKFVRVSDRAILRFLQNVHAIDVESIRAEIEAACVRGVNLGAPCIRVLGARFLVRNGTAVTCVETSDHLSHAGLASLIRERPLNCNEELKPHVAHRSFVTANYLAQLQASARLQRDRVSG